MRFGILTQYYPPEMGAPPARLHELARAFVAAGHDVFVLTAMPNYPRGRVFPGYGGLYKSEVLDGVSVQRAWLWPTKSVGMVRRVASYCSFAASSLAIGALAMPRVDVLLTESPPLFLGLAGLALARMQGARFLFNVSDLWPESVVRLGVIGPGLALDAAERLEQFLYEQAWLVTGQSEETLAQIGRRFPRVPRFHVSNGVDVTRFRPGLGTPEWRRLLGGEDVRCLAVYAGLHGVAQGLDQVLAAAARLEDVPGLRFAFIGDGPEKERLVSAGGRLRNVRFLDPQPHGVMPALLASADIALVPLGTALPGAVPSKIYEAMGAGVPVALVADGEPARIVERAQAGVAVRPGDVEGLVAALRALATDESRRRELGARGRAAAVDRYDRARIASRFIRELEWRLGARPEQLELRVASG